MSPFERAIYLVRQFDYSVKYALIAVNEMMEMPLIWFTIETSLENDQSDTFEYWVEVKEEIQKL